MSYTKGQWAARDSAIGVVSDADDQSFGMMLSVAYVEQYDMPDEWEYNAKRIVDCVNACDGMESPADEIAELRRARGELLKELDVLSNGYHGNGWDVGLASRLDSARNLVKKLKEK